LVETVVRAYATGNVGRIVQSSEQHFLAEEERLLCAMSWDIGWELHMQPSPDLAILLVRLDFADIETDDFRVVRDTLAGKKRTTKNRLVPFCMFTDPELARVGLNEKEARSRGLAYRLCKLPMTANLRARTLSETRGFMKALIAKESDQILGFTMFGVEAGEVISVAQTAMLGEMPYTVMRDAIYTHPTIAEGLNVLFRAPPV
jgi:hypothetical protein